MINKLCQNQIQNNHKNVIHIKILLSHKFLNVRYIIFLSCSLTTYNLPLVLCANVFPNPSSDFKLQTTLFVHNMHDVAFETATQIFLYS